MNFKKYLFGLVLICFSTLAVYGTCSVSFDAETYRPTDTITASLICTANNEEEQEYTLTWENDTATVETDVGITPPNDDTYFFQTFQIPSAFNGNITATLTGTNLEGSDTAEVSGNDSRILKINDLTFSPYALPGRMFTSEFSLTDTLGKEIDGARCIVYSTDNTGLPLQSCETDTSKNGIGVCGDILSKSSYIEGNQYIVKISCSCGIGDNACFDEDGNTIEKYKGSTAKEFTINNWLSVNTLVDKEVYQKKQEVFVCANLSSTTLEDRIPVSIYHQVRCSAEEYNDEDLDRAIIVSDNGIPDQRGISTNTTQTQCKRFYLPEPRYMQGLNSTCYASTDVWILDENGEEIYGYHTTSPPFTVVSTELNLYVDWAKVDQYNFNTIIDLNSSDYRDFDGSGIGNIDIRINADKDESLKHYEQYGGALIDFHSLIDADHIDSVVGYDINGTPLQINIEWLEDGYLELEIQDVDISRSGWYNVSLTLNSFDERTTIATENLVTATQELANYTDNLVTATENQAGISSFSTLNKSDYVGTEELPITTIDETALIKFNLELLQNPAYGDQYRTIYNFYSRSGNGELIESVETYVQGSGNKSVYFKSDMLDPIGSSETYLIESVISMQNSDGLWEEFTETEVGYLKVNSLASSTGDGTGVGRVGFYDVIVNLVKDKYEPEQEIKADILIKNTGDLPDEDTVLVYWLEDPSRKRFGETKEQILEVPAGETVLRRSVTLPSDTMLGEWRFVAEYNTVVQPQIVVYDSFEVLPKVGIMEDVKQLFGVGDRDSEIVEYVYDNKWSWFAIGGVVLLLFIWGLA
jgi:hypothetical protein